MNLSLIVSASGIRGVVGDGLDPAVAARYGAAYGSYLAADGTSGGRVLLARDSRTSGEALADAVAAGLRATGWTAVDAGIVPTPTALLAVGEDPELRGGVIVTASHNPPEWNGLKLASSTGEFLSAADGRRVRGLYEEGGIRYSGWRELGGRETLSGAADRHVERILELPIVDRDGVASAGLTVALDGVRGAAGPVLSDLLERLGCTVEGIGLEPDGRFPRNPEPRPENLGELGSLVRETGADLGMAVDPDGDRLALVDGEGRPPGEDWTLALAAEFVLDRRPGPLVTNLSSSRAILDAADRAGRAWHLAPVGEANVAERMREVDAAVGGEGNGGVMLPELHLTRDAPLAAALILSLLAETGDSLERLVSERPGYHIAKRRAPVSDAPLDELYDALREVAPPGWEEDVQDGLRLDWLAERRWLHVRPSGTEPIIRVVAEAPESGSAEELAGIAVGAIEGWSEQT